MPSRPERRSTPARGRKPARSGSKSPRKPPEPRKVREPEGDSERPDKVRLNKYLADAGVASRRACDLLISKGKVLVDGEPVTELGTKVVPGRQRIEVEGESIVPPRTKRYYLLNKPRGVVCTSDRRESKPRAIDLINDRGKGRIYTVGRLDEDSSGLLLLTNDGAFANRVAHPRYGVPKTYHVKVKGKITSGALDRLRKGVHLAEGKASTTYAKVRKRSTRFSVLTITLREGKNRELRRMLAKVGHDVLTVRRTKVGHLAAPRLRLGEWRLLTTKEIENLLAVADEAKTSLPLEPRRSPKRGRTSRSATGGARGTRGTKTRGSRTRGTTIRGVKGRPADRKPVRKPAKGRRTKRKSEKTS